MCPAWGRTATRATSSRRRAWISDRRWPDLRCTPGSSSARSASTLLHKAGGRLIWQFGENEELTRLYLDDSLQRGGYAAISTFHFGNPDFTNSEPFLKHYWQQIPFVALQDAHGKESWWWLDMLTGFRTLFLATEPTWEGWLKALKNNWVVAVRHDRVSGNADLDARRPAGGARLRPPARAAMALVG